ncbi:hypothetical protein V1511DRAFT_496061 [Dipodascopsis uninucleata]
MSNQSGISASEGLLKVFRDFAADDQARSLLIKIEKETLVPGELIKAKNGFLEDISLLEPHVSDNEPLYIIYRGGEGTATGTSGGFTFISYIPDAAPVRNKMLYASTRNTLIRELGGDKIALSFFTTEKSELSPEGLQKFLEHEKSSGPMTEEERALKSVIDIEAKEGFAGTSTRRSHVSSGLSFPISDDAKDALAELAKSSDAEHNVVILSINPSNESIELDHKGLVEEPTHLQNVISKDAPRYTFLLFKHQHDGEDHNSTVFIYTCPSSSKIKERMLYASCRSSIIAEAEAAFGITIDKRIEAGEGSDISTTSLIADLHPQKVEKKTAFARPKAPGRRR